MRTIKIIQNLFIRNFLYLHFLKRNQFPTYFSILLTRCYSITLLKEQIFLISISSSLKSDPFAEFQNGISEEKNFTRDELWTAFFLSLFFSRINAFSSPTIFPLLMEGIDRPEHNVLDDYRGRGSRKKSIYGRVTFTVVRKAPVTFESRAIDTLSAAQSTLIIIY